jgi:acetolactate synthase-1/2/3 large subunit
VKSADLIIIVGCKLGEIATDRWSLIPSSAKCIQIDIDGGQIGKVQRVDVGVTSDAAAGLADLALELGAGQAGHSARRTPAEAEIAEANRIWGNGAHDVLESDDVPIRVGRVIAEVQRALSPSAVVVTDGGFAAHWTAFLLQVGCGRHYIANRGQASIGYGLPGAIGASLAVGSDVPVIALCGDNGFAMTIAELETAKRTGCRLIVIVLNNLTLGYVKSLQSSLYEGRHISVDFLDVDYASAARAFGCRGVRVDSPAALSRTLSDALTTSDPTVIDVRVTTDPTQMLPGIDSRTQQRPAMDS